MTQGLTAVIVLATGFGEIWILNKCVYNTKFLFEKEKILKKDIKTKPYQNTYNLSKKICFFQLAASFFFCHYVVKMVTTELLKLSFWPLWIHHRGTVVLAFMHPKSRVKVHNLRHSEGTNVNIIHQLSLCLFVYFLSAPSEVVVVTKLGILEHLRPLKGLICIWYYDIIMFHGNCLANG